SVLSACYQPETGINKPVSGSIQLLIIIILILVMLFGKTCHQEEE
ncbi:hypothetical protein HMPREF9534_00526, partial [Escherichia coli MS 69-1]